MDGSPGTVVVPQRVAEPGLIGKTLAHYEITGLLGRGGMGEVYRARDTKLRRDVAIKVLPRAFSRDPERISRFQREAQTLASFHHPHIASIFGFEDTGDQRFLVMELVEGDDLSVRLRRGPIPMRKALEIARQIAEGLGEAHEKGIIHRDLKPANVKCRPDGTVKVLDFGLARAYLPRPADEEVASNDPTIPAPLTELGTVTGTAAYMSPEQARGAELDRRTDIWAFGCVLYEMLTGKRCFPGDTPTDILAKIVTHEPDWSALPRELPLRVRELLMQTLEKDPRQRWRDMGDVELVLEQAENGIANPPPPSVTERRISGPLRWGILVVLLAAILVGLLTKPWIDHTEPTNLLADATFTRITDQSGSESCVAISRDGSNIACLSDRGGRFNIWVIPVGTGQPYNLTQNDSQGVVSFLRAVDFTPDGSEIWLPGTLHGRLRRMPLLGGTPRNWLGPHAINASWSPDGSRVVYSTSDPGDPLIVAKEDGSDRHEILDFGAGYHQHFPTWGADDWIYMVRGQENMSEMDLWRVRPDGSHLEPLETGTRLPAFPTPIDARTLLFVAQEPDGAGPWLWSLDLETGSVRRLSYGLEQYTSVAASMDGRRLVASVATPQVGLWQVPISDAVASESSAIPLELPTLRALAPRFGPKDLFYLSSRGTRDGVWRLRDGTVQEIWKGSETPLLEPVGISTDGNSIALVLRKGERNVLHILSADGAELRALSADIDVRGSVSWSPDGEWIAAGGEDLEGNPGLFLFGADGDRVERIVQSQAVNPVWSPRGNLIVYDGAQVNAVSPILGVRPDGTSVELPPLEALVPGQRARFLPDGQGLVHMKSSTNFHQDFWLLDLTTMEDRQLTRLDDAGTIRHFDITPDGSQIVFDRLNENGDVVMIDLAER